MSAYPNIQEYHNFRPKNTASLDILYVEDVVGLCKQSIWGMFVTPNQGTLTVLAPNGM